MYEFPVRRVLSALLFTASAALLALPPAAADSFWSQLFDPSDGQFDVSGLVASERGFLPEPILITEP